MDVEAILRELVNAPDYAGQIVHIERIAPRQGRFGKPKTRLPFALERALDDLGIERLYSHQAEALDALAKGENVVIATGPASGKSLCYQLPILASRLARPSERSLLLFPTKALAQDQMRAMERLAAGISGLILGAGVLDGDTPPGVRRKLRQSGRVIFSNPDFLHACILPQHPRWATFFENLRYIVLDELHVYSGFFGANVGNLFRRLRRLLDHYGSSPQVICCSATIANPRELAERLVGLPMRLIEEDGSPCGAKTYVLWNPPVVREHGRYRRRSANVEAHRIAARLIANRIPTIVFSKAKITAELIYRYVREELERMGSSLARRVMPYRGGYLPDERRQIEKRLFSGELLGVSTTPALEMGIDVGSLEATIIVGYPGRLARFFQQAGRAGRRDRDSLVVLVGLDTLINQWLMRHPEYLFGRPVERVVVDLDNAHVVAGHLRCAAAELPIQAGELENFGRHAREAIAVLEEKRKLKRVGERWYHASPETPQHEVSLRASGEGNVLIVDADHGDRVIGEIDRYDAQPIVHPGAIYMHLGETYEVERLDLDRNLAVVRKVEVDYYTQPIGGTDVDHIDRALRERALGTGRAFFGEVTAYFTTYAYEKIRFYSLEAFSHHRLDLPVETLETLAFWIEAPEALMRDVFSRGLDAYAGLRGIGYATRMVLPLFVSAETLDFSHSVGSRNSPWHTVFVYERHPRGLGYVERAYDILEEILEVVYERVRDCDCQDGCPCCVGKPLRAEATWNIERGEGSIPSRLATLRVLEGLLGKRAIEVDATAIEAQPERPDRTAETHRQPLPVDVERAIRRRLERMRQAKLLHRVAPDPPVGYPPAEKVDSAAVPDVAERLRHRIKAERERWKRRAAEKRINKDVPELPEKVDRSQPPEPLPEVGPRVPEAQAERMRIETMIASVARRRAREKARKQDDG